MISSLDTPNAADREREDISLLSSSPVSFYESTEWKRVREIRGKRANWLAAVAGAQTLGLYSLGLDSCTEHAARRGRTRSWGGIAALLSLVPRDGRGGRNDGIVVLGVARIEFLPARGKKKRRHASSASDLNYCAARKNGSTRVENLSARVDREIYGVAMPENAREGLWN